MAARRHDSLHDLVGDFRPLTPRRRILTALLAVAVAAVVVLVLLYPPGGVQRTRPKAPALCVNGQPPGCIDGKIGVIVVTPLAPASAPRPAASR
jgi:hypothetical protein